MVLYLDLTVLYLVYLYLYCTQNTDVYPVYPRFGEDLSLDSDDGSMVSSSSGYTIGEVTEELMHSLVPNLTKKQTDCI